MATLKDLRSEMDSLKTQLAETKAQLNAQALKGSVVVSDDKLGVQEQVICTRSSGNQHWFKGRKRNFKIATTSKVKPVAGRAYNLHLKRGKTSGKLYFGIGVGYRVWYAGRLE